MAETISFSPQTKRKIAESFPEVWHIIQFYEQERDNANKH
jgi:hypothetical protein